VNCRRTSSLLSALIDGELCGAEAVRVREHIQKCDCCRREYESLLQTKRMLSGLQVVEPPPDFERRLVASLQNAPCEPRWIRALLAWWDTCRHGERVRAAALLAAASLIVLALSVRLTMTNRQGPAVARMTIDTMADARGNLLPESDIGFAHETFDRPQPVTYRSSIANRAVEDAPAVRPLPSWYPYAPVSSAP